jgi:hypothetical protein
MWRVRRPFAGLVEYNVDLVQREPGDLDVEIDRDQALQLDRQQLLVPPGIEGELVIGQYIGPPLRHIEMGETQRRDALQPKKFCGLDTAVAGDDLAVLPDQHRVGEPEPPDAVGDLLHLLLGMGARIARIGPQPRHRHRLDDAALAGIG